MAINDGREIDGDTYFYRRTRKRQAATTEEVEEQEEEEKGTGPRQFDTVYGKHISVAITSWGKQASKQAANQPASKQASKQD